MWENMWIIWLVIAVSALTIDLITSSFLFVWFTLGGILAIIADLLNYSFTVQILIFISVSALLMAIGYPIVKKTIKKTIPKTPTMEENYIGKQFIIDEDVIDKAMIKYKGIYWTIKNDGDAVKKGDKVKITGIEGNKIIIKKI